MFEDDIRAVALTIEIPAPDNTASVESADTLFSDKAQKDIETLNAMIEARNGEMAELSMLRNNRPRKAAFAMIAPPEATHVFPEHDTALP